MSRAAKVPQSYEFYIAALQRIVTLTKKDERITTTEHEKVRKAVTEITIVMAEASRREVRTA